MKPAVLAMTFLALTATAAEAQPQKISGFKRDTVRFLDKNNRNITEPQPVSEEIRALLLGAAVDYDKNTGLFSIRIDGSTVYLNSQDIRVEHGVGAKDVIACPKLAEGTKSKGSSGFGIKCPN